MVKNSGGAGIGGGSFFGGSKFLCDTCLKDYGNVCNLPDRPNATECSEYVKRGKSV